jgi:hypothetical protein
MADRANQEQVNALRRPLIIYTDAYLNDPIQFTRDIRFDAESALRNADPNLPIIDRDEAEFAVVDLNSQDSQYYTAQTYRDEVNRDDYQKVIAKKRKIIELIAAENA